MRAYPVYRLDPTDQTVIRVGSIIERRRSRRSLNRVGLAKVAQKAFGAGAGDIIFIGPDSILERATFKDEQVSILSAG